MELNNLSSLLGVENNLSVMQLIDLTRNGLQKSVVDDLANYLKLSTADFSKLLQSLQKEEAIR